MAKRVMTRCLKATALGHFGTPPPAPLWRSTCDAASEKRTVSSMLRPEVMVGSDGKGLGLLLLIILPS